VDVEHELALVRREQDVLADPLGAGEAATFERS
jgi:hypothetical protein